MKSWLAKFQPGDVVVVSFGGDKTVGIIETIHKDGSLLVWVALEMGVAGGHPMMFDENGIALDHCCNDKLVRVSLGSLPKQEVQERIAWCLADMLLNADDLLVERLKQIAKLIVGK